MGVVGEVVVEDRFMVAESRRFPVPFGTTKRW